jgi:hypothetical protein
MFRVVRWSASRQATWDTPTGRRSRVPFRTHVGQGPLSSWGYTRHTSTPGGGVHEPSRSAPGNGEPWWLLWVQWTVHRFR